MQAMISEHMGQEIGKIPSTHLLPIRQRDRIRDELGPGLHSVEPLMGQFPTICPDSPSLGSMPLLFIRIGPNLTGSDEGANFASPRNRTGTCNSPKTTTKADINGGLPVTGNRQSPIHLPQHDFNMSRFSQTSLAREVVESFPDRVNGKTCESINRLPRSAHLTDLGLAPFQS